ncbi:MAG: hypothetical protein KDF67_00305, partial [Ottowia sp.]|nr:hypothetical protein [Ottowia sp.]
MGAQIKHPTVYAGRARLPGGAAPPASSLSDQNRSVFRIGQPSIAIKTDADEAVVNPPARSR